MHSLDETTRVWKKPMVLLKGQDLGFLTVTTSTICWGILNCLIIDITGHLSQHILLWQLSINPYLILRFIHFIAHLWLCSSHPPCIWCLRLHLIYIWLLPSMIRPESRQPLCIPFFTVPLFLMMITYTVCMIHLRPINLCKFFYFGLTGFMRTHKTKIIVVIIWWRWRFGTRFISIFQMECSLEVDSDTLMALSNGFGFVHTGVKRFVQVKRF